MRIARRQTLAVTLLIMASIGCAHRQTVKTGALSKGQLVTGTVAEPAAHAMPVVFAVLDFENQTGKDSWHHLEKALPDLVSTRLAAQPGFKVVERRRISEIMEEQHLTLTGAIDPTTAMRIGTLIGANIILFGSVTQLDNDLLMSIRMAQVDTGEIIGGFTEKGRGENDLDEMCGRTVNRISKTVRYK
jgi:curli biogenesis system outer membrane secretion channel CsgG